jgi:hypothetical protein
MFSKIACIAFGFAVAWPSFAHAASGPSAPDSVAPPNPARVFGEHPWAFLDAPPPAPPPLPPDPAPEADEHARHPWELSPEFGMGAPFCRGGGIGPAGCSGTGAGPALAFTALYRLTPYLAFGADGGFANFRDDAAGPDGHSRSNWFGAIVRGYFTESGVVDPYVEVGFGRGAVESQSGDLHISGAGPSTMAGVGIDFWVAPFLRIGPAFSYRWTWLSTLDVCSAGVCGAASVADSGAVGSYASLGLVATIGFGREM